VQQYRTLLYFFFNSTVAKKFKKKMFITYFAKFIGTLKLASRAEALCFKTMVRRSFCVAATSETHFFRRNGVHKAVLVVGVQQSDREISALCSKDTKLRRTMQQYIFFNGSVTMCL